jgi:hypothetical protein
MTLMWSGGIRIMDTPDMRMFFLTHEMFEELRFGLNPELNVALCVRLLGDER